MASYDYMYSESGRGFSIGIGSSNDHILESGTGFFQEEAIVHFTEINDLYKLYWKSYNNNTRRVEEETFFYGPLIGFDNSGYYTPVNLVGMKNGAKEEAATFINLMLSDEVQVDINDAIPVNKNAITSHMLQAKENFLKVEVESDIIAILENLQMSNSDEILHEMAKEVTLQFYEGEILLEQAVLILKEKSALYLAEKQ